MLPPASALHPNVSLLASLFVGSGLCFLHLAGNNSAGRSSSPCVASSFLRHIQSFHTSTERSKVFKLSRCLLSADGSLSPCHSTSSKYFCISCRCFCDSPCTTGFNCSAIARRVKNVSAGQHAQGCSNCMPKAPTFCQNALRQIWRHKAHFHFFTNTTCLPVPLAWPCATKTVL